MADPVITVSECFRHDGAMSDWERLGRYVVARRVELGFKRRGEFATALQVSTRVVGDLETGRRGNFDATTFASLERVLGWETGTARRVADGEDPRLRTESTNDDSAAPSGGARRTPDEIDMIYRSQTMTALEKLDAIRKVLELRAQVDAESGPPVDDDGLRSERPRTASGG